MPNKNQYSNIDFSDTSIAFENYNSKKLQKTYYIFALMNRNLLVKIGTFFLKKGLDFKIPIKNIIKNTIFEHFCGGESINDCQNTINSLHKYGVGTILDYSVEGEESDFNFELTKNEIIQTILLASQNHDKIPFSVFKITGIGSSEILEKNQSPNYVLSPNEKAEFDKISARVYAICEAAYKHNVKIFIDAEETWIQHSIDELAMDMMQKFNKEKAIVYNTYQFYLKKSLKNLKSHNDIGLKNGFKIGAKLVRGAYMEKERLMAEKGNYEDPINENKAKTDQEFNGGLAYCIENIENISFCLGTHNEESSRLGLKLIESKGLEVDDERVYFAQLLGMSDNITYNLAKNSVNVAKYVPYGPVEAVMPYLIRRAEENTSIAGQSGREYLLIKKEIKRRRQKTQ